jgi:hypothetical protein
LGQHYGEILGYPIFQVIESIEKNKNENLNNSKVSKGYKLKKPNKNSVLLGFSSKDLVETAGIEPASASTVP